MNKENLFGVLFVLAMAFTGLAADAMFESKVAACIVVLGMITMVVTSKAIGE